MSGRRLRTCVENWPEAETGDYDPRCCRFPKSCSATIYDEEHVTEADLEPRPTLPDLARAFAGRTDAPEPDDDEVERVARAIGRVDHGIGCDSECDPMREPVDADYYRDLARAAIGEMRRSR